MIIKNKNKILIVGYGQDAKVLKDQASKDNKKIYIITNSKKNIKEKNVFFKTLDIKDKNKVSKYLKNFKNLHIYFFATHNISSTEEENSQIFYKNLETNVISLTNFLEFMSKNKKKNFKLFYACSSHIYENSLSTKQNEKTTPLFSSHYALTKYLGLEICHYYRNIKNIFCSVGILYTHTSKHVNNNFLIKELSIKIKKTKNRKVYVKNVNSIIDLMSASDAVRAMRNIMDLKKSDTFIISSGRKTSIKIIFNEILILFNIKDNFQILNKKKITKKQKILFGDNRKLKIKTNWSSKNNLKDIIKEVLS
jgi:GDPmannose 4,6-dehydratase